jgi:hypothetical protein
MPVIPATREEEVRESKSKASLGKNMRLCLKNKLKAKRAGEVAQEVQHFPRKHKAMSSNPAITKK